MWKATVLLLALVAVALAGHHKHHEDTESCSVRLDGNLFLATTNAPLVDNSSISIDMWIRPTVESVFNFGVLAQVPFQTTFMGEPISTSFVLKYDYFKRRIVVDTWIIGETGLEFISLVSPPFTVIPEVWTHVAYIPSYGLLALNGQRLLFSKLLLLVSNKAIEAPSSIVIGSQFSGNIDELRVWDRVLSHDEVESIMHKNPCYNNESLIVYFPFDECSGGTAADLGTASLCAEKYLVVLSQEDDTPKIEWDEPSLAEQSDCAADMKKAHARCKNLDQEEEPTGCLTFLGLLWFLCLIITILAFCIGCVKLTRSLFKSKNESIEEAAAEPEIPVQAENPTVGQPIPVHVEADAPLPPNVFSPDDFMTDEQLVFALQHMHPDMYHMQQSPFLTEERY